MNKQQLETATRGVRLLTGHLRGRGESLDAAVGEKDDKAVAEMADPLVNVAIILVRHLKTELQCEVAGALERARSHARAELDEYWLIAARLIETVISGEAPGTIEEGPVAVAIGAQEVATGAAIALGAALGVHPNAAVAKIRKLLREQGEAVQLSDKAGIDANAARYASDPEMRVSRRENARGVVVAINGAAVAMHNRGVALRDDGRIDAADSYEGVARIAVTAAALGGGVCQLIECDNHYPAYALIRQIVETEFVLWKFQQDVDLIPEWLNSDRDRREQGWKPSRIYRDDDNEYRQKDYSGHCELGGHPTPLGTRLASGERSDIAEASVLGDLIGHLRDSWRHILQAADDLDTKYSQSPPSVAADVRASLDESLLAWANVDKYRFTVSYFSDPID
ncbi:hypothetical protein [Williamsia muralis]|uniref:hypothetical protein n=1 Tax=Williamsia marianensis TaxID=85044 RepID=UPI000DE66E37|nr:hypothetical protein [Williamsia marianensis]PVY33665.1 hypothetical protein C7458_10162 [Williamsia marianensis]